MQHCIHYYLGQYASQTGSRGFVRGCKHVCCLIPCYNITAASLSFVTIPFGSFHCFNTLSLVNNYPRGLSFIGLECGIETWTHSLSEFVHRNIQFILTNVCRYKYYNIVIIISHGLILCKYCGKEGFKGLQILPKYVLCQITFLSTKQF